MTPATDSPATATGELPALRTARRTGLIDQVIDQLRDQITGGAWAIGDRIPTEAELAALTGTSRNTVREAVQSLVHAGLLERRQGSGTYVLAASELAGAVSRRVAGAHQHHILEVRRTLEVGAARLAAGRRTTEDLARLRALLARRTAASRAGDIDGVVDHDVELHRAIGQAAHNPVLTDLYANFLDALSQNVRLNVAVYGHLDDSEHVALVDAIEAGDPEAAAAEAACFLDVLLEELPAE
jgi:DNA-binding FadR family transcriptional regulator